MLRPTDTSTVDDASRGLIAEHAAALEGDLGPPQPSALEEGAAPSSGETMGVCLKNGTRGRAVPIRSRVLAAPIDDLPGRSDPPASLSLLPLS
jgi:hypothetical protein